jgi:hypothetical protein
MSVEREAPLADLAWSEATLARLYAGRDPEKELIKCFHSPRYFVDEYVWIYNATAKAWVKMVLWPAQQGVLDQLHTEQYVIVLKARQLGMSWLTLSYALWMMLFRPAASILFMSKREDEAVELLANRLMPMHFKLPAWMQADRVVKGATREFFMSNGSQARAFSTGGGRSYTASMAVLDEADYVQDLNKVLNALKPTVDAGGKLALISTVDKGEPMSAFKQIVRGAFTGENSYRPIFLPWGARPGRDQAWYERVSKDMFAQDGSNDNLWQEYPASVEEALAPRQLDKRLALEWITQCEALLTRIYVPGGPTLTGLRVYTPPEPGKRYVVGGDPAEGNPRSDDSVAVVLDQETWAEVACLVGKIEPDTFAEQVKLVSDWYNKARILIERNNHGHAVLLALRKLCRERLLEGHDAPRREPGKPPPPDAARKYGWLQNEKGKSLMYDLLAETLRSKGCRIRTQAVALQLSTIEASTLSAPEGQHDDYATAFALAVSACRLSERRGLPSTVIGAADPLVAMDSAGWDGRESAEEE